ncbi:hypothetical protein Q7C_1077 [Methylophaga frappieri]|uniref:Uncharacterized protein n=1 Tax=Methylophaga frappieri (strain ATCC BAA-2434 / DSM 25690 / JAM7) TaxID=754477 RepID=I1YH41_METFJ|nr:hypothetical protein Q7C_1077 [Methylophaga frappieri]
MAVIAADKVSLAETLRAAYTTGGIEAVSAKFEQIWPADKAEYDANPTELMVLMQEVAQTGDMAAISVFGNINGQVLQDQLNQQQLENMIDYQDHSAAINEAVTKQETQANADDTQQAMAINQQKKGKARTDLDRFSGLYAKAGDPPAKSIFVGKTCDGLLAMSPIWADLAPWRMRSATDTVFTYSDSFTDFAVAFELNPQQQAVAFTHDIEGIANPLVRVGDLPSDYADCLPAPLQ